MSLDVRDVVEELIEEALLLGREHPEDAVWISRSTHNNGEASSVPVLQRERVAAPSCWAHDTFRPKFSLTADCRDATVGVAWCLWKHNHTNEYTEADHGDDDDDDHYNVKNANAARDVEPIKVAAAALTYFYDDEGIRTALRVGDGSRRLYHRVSVCNPLVVLESWCPLAATHYYDDDDEEQQQQDDETETAAVCHRCCYPPSWRNIVLNPQLYFTPYLCNATTSSHHDARQSSWYDVWSVLDTVGSFLGPRDVSHRLAVLSRWCWHWCSHHSVLLVEERERLRWSWVFKETSSSRWSASDDDRRWYEFRHPWVPSRWRVLEEVRRRLRLVSVIDELEWHKNNGDASRRVLERCMARFSSCFTRRRDAHEEKEEEDECIRITVSEVQRSEDAFCSGAHVHSIICPLRTYGAVMKIIDALLSLRDDTGDVDEVDDSRGAQHTNERVAIEVWLRMLDHVTMLGAGMYVPSLERAMVYRRWAVPRRLLAWWPRIVAAATAAAADTERMVVM